MNEPESEDPIHVPYEPISVRQLKRKVRYLTEEEIVDTFRRLGLDESRLKQLAELRKLGETPPEPPQRVVTTDNTTEDAIDHE